MVVAGNETTTKLLGHCWYWGWRNPEQLAKPLADRAAVAALGRGDAALRHTRRQILARTTDGRRRAARRARSRPATRVLLLVGSANRDERVFPDPDRYDLDRDTTELLSFGSGRHFCLGASLARLEAKVVLEQLRRPGRVVRHRRERRPPGALGQRPGLRAPADLGDPAMTVRRRSRDDQGDAASAAERVRR